MARPADWEPLAAADPVPGDPAGISAAVAYLSGVAEQLQGQIGQLRKIAVGGSEERGQHVVKLKSAASDTAGQLEQVVGRYQKTASALGAWVPELEYAQSQSLKALAAAQDAAARQRASQPVIRPAGQQETAQDKQEDQARQAALGQATADLAAARQMLASATSYRDQKAAETRARIESAINDGLKDSIWGDIGQFFGSIGNWLENNWVWIVRDICTACEIVATILAIVALFATGIGWLLLVAFILTAIALAGRTLLAATGNGSWLDVGMDAIALLTLGIGGGVSGSAGMVGRAGQTVDKAIEVGDELAKAERAASLSGRAASFFDRIVQRINATKWMPDFLARPFAWLGKTATDWSEEGRPLAREVADTVEKTTPWQRIFNTGEEPARFALKMAKLVERFPYSTEIKGLSGKLGGQLWQLRGVVGAGAAVSIGSLGLGGGLPLYGPNGWHWQPYDFTWWDQIEQGWTVTLPDLLLRLDLAFLQHHGRLIGP